jgi:hypothetical protein
LESRQEQQVIQQRIANSFLLQAPLCPTLLLMLLWLLLMLMELQAQMEPQLVKMEMLLGRVPCGVTSERLRQ